MRILLTCLICMVVAGCAFGPHVDDLEPANGGAGATVRVNRVSGASITGELIGWSEEGLVLRTLRTPENRSLYLVPEQEIRSVQIPEIGTFRGNAARLGLEGAMGGARYLRRIDNELLARLLDAYGQTELVRPR